METDRQQVVAGGPWAACFTQAEVAAIASLRLNNNVLACTVDGQVWLRGESLDEPLDQALRRLAPIRRFTVDSDGGLMPLGNLLPSAQLPQGNWAPLSELISVQSAPAAFPGEPRTRVPIKIVRGDHPRPAEMLLADLLIWGAYADGAPAIRLAPLRFAAKHKHVVIWGNPLPPIPGIWLYEEAGIAIPCGLKWSPAIDAQSLRRALALPDGEMAIFFQDGSWQLIPGSSFVQARRSAVRLTIRELTR